jgi:hypothetical protein
MLLSKNNLMNTYGSENLGPVPATVVIKFITRFPLI